MESIDKIIDQHYSEAGRASIKCSIKKAFKHFNITDPNMFLRNGGQDLIDYTDKATIFYRIIGFVKKLNPGVEIPKIVSKRGAELRKMAKQDTFERKRTQKPNELLCINKIQQHYHDQLYKPIVNTSKATGKKLAPRTPRPSVCKHTRCALFTILQRCPLRFSSVCDLEWQDDGKNNCIDLGTKKLIIRNSKTSRKKKKAGINCNISLPDEAIDTLTKYKTYMGNPKYVFPKGDTHKSSNDISQCYLSAVKLFMGDKYKKGDKIGIHMLRSIAATEDFKKCLVLREGATLEDVERMFANAFERGHSIKTSIGNYVLHGE
jgi:hypothetical protein